MTLLDRVIWLYKNNHKTGESSGIHYDYTCPSPGNYPHQWLWDSCFHSIVLTHFDIERAKREIRTLLSGQRENGFLPCCTLWKKRFPFEETFYRTQISQPPVPPIAIEIIYDKSKDLNFLKEVYPKLKAFMKWYAGCRDSNNNGLIEAIHPWETGIDSTPTFDKQLGIRKPHPNFGEFMLKYYWIFFRYYLLGWDEKEILSKKIFLSDNLLINSIYAKALKSMSRLALILGNENDFKDFDDRYKVVLAALIKYSWSEEDKIFYDLDENDEQVKIKTISSLMPLILDDLPKKFVEDLIGHLTDKNEYWCEYPIPSVSMDEKTFSSGGGFVLWRGPTWINTNWFITKALLHRGYKKEARIIIDKTAEMVDKSGFWEYYNPLTGEGYGQPSYGWSALVLDMV